MPTWLVHGFRWPRKLIRIHIILQNLDDAAAEWLMAPATSAALTENFHKLYPDMMADLPSLRFIEQYDPEDLTSKDQPYAYVCDQVHEVQLGVDIDEVRGKGVANDAWAALVDLRDKIAPGEKVAWFVVVNGDVERWVPPVQSTIAASSVGSQLSPTSRSSVARTGEEEVGQSQQGKRKGFKKWLESTRMKRAKSSKDLRGDLIVKRALQSPPLPLRTATAPSQTNGKATLPTIAAG